MKNVKEYYKLLGKLAYSVAMADGVIQKEESQKLKNKILTEFAHQESGFDSSGMNKAFYVDFEFEASTESLPEWHETIKHFVDFINEHYEKGDDNLIFRSVQLLKEIAESYSKDTEKAIIETLQNKINNTLYL